jgi:hypothetical protein
VKAAFHRIVIPGIVFWLMVIAGPLAAQATVGWEVGDIVLDFGLGLGSGEQVVLVDKYEVGHPLFVELTWKLHSEQCVLQIQETSGQSDTVLIKTVHDDGLLDGLVSHSVHSEVEAVIMAAGEGKQCEINPSEDEILGIARKPRAPVSVEEGRSPAPIGAVVMAFGP